MQVPLFALLTRAGGAIQGPPYNCVHDITTDMFRQLGEHVGRLSADASVRVAIISGAGDRLYTVGADVREIAVLARQGSAARQRGARAWVKAVGDALSRIETSPKPFICAMKGISFGGGLELAAACDIRVAAAGAQFCMPELRLGLIPGYGGTQRLLRLIGPGATRLFIMTGAVIGTDEALRIGLVDAQAPEGHELGRAEQIAAAIARQAPLAVAALKQVLRQGADLPLAEALALEGRIFSALGASPDSQEGVLSFVEKREPVWSGICPTGLKGFV